MQGAEVKVCRNQLVHGRGVTGGYAGWDVKPMLKRASWQGRPPLVLQPVHFIMSQKLRA